MVRRERARVRNPGRNQVQRGRGRKREEAKREGDLERPVNQEAGRVGQVVVAEVKVRKKAKEVARKEK